MLKMERFYKTSRKITLTSTILLVLLSFSGYSSATHFITVWQGENGQDHMNFMVVSAVVEGVALSVDDEIAVFSGSKCVGAAKLMKAINPADNTTFLNFSASRDDGSGNGFVENDTIIFKIWDNKNQNEVVVTSATYRSEISTWLTTGKYSAGATSVVAIASSSEFTQTINFIRGNNLFSTYLIPTNADVSVVMKSLCDQGYLSKMYDEAGNTLAKSKNGPWINNIGSLQQTEGYLVSITSNCSLQIKGGSMVKLPLNIPLKAGWNYISFPRTTAVNAMTIVQSLIDTNKLVKVQDELGNSIENLKRYGGWKNSIGNFIPGKSYKVNVSSDAVLTIQ